MVSKTSSLRHLDYFASSRRRALTWLSLLGSGLIGSLASASPPKMPPDAGADRRPAAGASGHNRTQQQVATDSSAVTDVIMRERLAREIHNFANEAACFHPQSIVEVSWFKGTGAEFVEAARSNPDTETVHFDSMSPGVVALKGDRAIVDTACAVHTFSRLDDIEVSTTSYTRLLWRVQRVAGQWLISGLRGIYIRDTLIPRDPEQDSKIRRRETSTVSPVLSLPELHSDCRRKPSSQRSSRCRPARKSPRIESGRERMVGTRLRSETGMAHHPRVYMDEHGPLE